MLGKHLSKLKTLATGLSKQSSINLASKSISTSSYNREKLSILAANIDDLQKNGVQFGQPTNFSHPHLLETNELAVGISLNEFKDRRQKLIENIQNHCIVKNRSEKNIVVVPASGKKYMSDKIPYVFRQNSDFYYLSGCLEPDSILVMCGDESKHTKSILFMRPKNANDELWDGPRTGVDRSIDFFGVDEAYPITEFKTFLQKYYTSNTVGNLWYDESAAVQPQLIDILKKCNASATHQFESPTIFLHQQRLIKSAAEIDLMRRTCEIASEAINLTMKESSPGDSEHHIFARVDYHSRMKNASFLAYPPVVAAGNNATTIHYINNTQIAKDGDLVLMDAGCEYGGYSSDITRTWPINGTFTPVQDVLYEIIFTVQSELLSAINTHENVTLDQLFDLMCFRLGKYLQEIGLVDKSLSGVAMARAAFKFCPHHVSHYLGMDIHDTPLIRRDRPLEPGMVFTVEPGLYIAAYCKDVPVEFRGIGIRIEDDILFNSNGNIEVLTAKCVKEKSNLNKLLAKK